MEMPQGIEPSSSNVIILVAIIVITIGIVIIIAIVVTFSPPKKYLLCHIWPFILSAIQLLLSTKLFQSIIKQ